MNATTQKLKYVQLADHIRDRIRSGELKVGDRLPSYTEMHRQFGAATATVQRVCDLLEQEQLIERRSGSGIYVSRPRRSVTGNIGFIGSDSYRMLDIPFHRHLTSAMQTVIESDRRHLLHLGTIDSWDASAFDKVDGVLLCNIEDPSAILKALPPDLPRVSVLTIVEGVTSVGVDDYGASQMAVRHLISLGHRRIACLMEKFPSEGRRRFAGYRDALREAGVEADPHWSRLTNSVYEGKPSEARTQSYREWAYQQMAAWIRDDWRNMDCSAILVQNEIAAIGVMQACQKEGIKVPRDVSVMCFDGTELCDLVSPHLSAVMLPLAQIGASAVGALNRQIAGEQPVAQAIMLPVSLRLGESIRSAPSSSVPVSGVLIECG